MLVDGWKESTKEGPKFKGKQLAGECAEPGKNNKEKWGEWKTGCIIIYFLNERHKSQEKCYLEFTESWEEEVADY